MRSRRHAFTLVELLVVIGIIAVLISILLPSLSKAMRAAKAIQCAANMRSIGQAMQIYVSENNGYFPGSPWSSGVALRNGAYDGSTGVTNDNCPGVMDIWDWQAPIAAEMGIAFGTGASQAERRDRFVQLMAQKQFQCPENMDVTTFCYNSGTTVPWPIIVQPSYETCVDFMLKRNERNPSNSPATVVGVYVTRTDYNAPVGYTPKITKVGNPSEKIYLGEGARYANHSTGPDYDMGVFTSLGGPFSDQRPWCPFNNSRDRYYRNNPVTAGAIDPLMFAFRHGSTMPFSGPDSLRANFLFFDGHVEMLGDLEAMNPAYWSPKGMELAINSGQMYKDCFNRFFPGQTYSGSGFVWVCP